MKTPSLFGQRQTHSLYVLRNDFMVDTFSSDVSNLTFDIHRHIAIQLIDLNELSPIEEVDCIRLLTLLHLTVQELIEN